MRHRVDLNYVLDILGGETAIGHSFTGGGDDPDVERVPVGLLGATSRWTTAATASRTIYTRRELEPASARAAERAGHRRQRGRLPAGGGRRRADRRHEPVQRCSTARPAGRRCSPLNAKPRRKDAREVTVVPVASEVSLRQRDWVEGNRRKVDELSGGKLAYVWVPDTGGGGYTYFNRYYFAQQDKQGAIIDERFNHGGSHRRLHGRPDVPRAAGLLQQPRGRQAAVHRAQRGHLGPQGPDHQRDGRLGRRHAALHVPQDGDRPAGRHPHLGRPGRHLGRARRWSTAASSPRRAAASTTPTATGRWRTRAWRRTSRSSRMPKLVNAGHDPQLERGGGDGAGAAEDPGGASCCPSRPTRCGSSGPRIERRRSGGSPAGSRNAQEVRTIRWQSDVALRDAQVGEGAGQHLQRVLRRRAGR